MLCEYGLGKLCQKSHCAAQVWILPVSRLWLRQTGTIQVPDEALCSQGSGDTVGNRQHFFAGLVGLPAVPIGPAWVGDFGIFFHLR